VLELWIEDDTKNLETGYQEGRPEPQVVVKTQQDVAEAQAEGHTGILEEASPEDVKAAEKLAAGGVIIEENVEEDLVDRFPDEPVLEGMDRIDQLLN